MPETVAPEAVMPETVVLEAVMQALTTSLRRGPASVSTGQGCVLRVQCARYAAIGILLAAHYLEPIEKNARARTKKLMHNAWSTDDHTKTHSLPRAHEWVSSRCRAQNGVDIKKRGWGRAGAGLLPAKEDQPTLLLWSVEHLQDLCK